MPEAFGITGVVLNWRRPANVARIVAEWRESGIVDEAIVWNNNPAAPLTLDGWARVVNTSHNHGLYTRFLAACLASNECVLIQDDDLSLPAASLLALHRAWQSDPETLHGIFGRVRDALGLYVARNALEDDVPVLLTRAIMTHRSHAARFFEFAAAFAELQRHSRPYGNGEDILFSCSVVRHTGRLNRVHRLLVTKLPAPHPLNMLDQGGHLAHRTRLMHACEARLLADPDTTPALAAALRRREPLAHSVLQAVQRGYLALRRRMR